MNVCSVVISTNIMCAALTDQCMLDGQCQAIMFVKVIWSLFL